MLFGVYSKLYINLSYSVIFFKKFILDSVYAKVIPGKGNKWGYGKSFFCFIKTKTSSFYIIIR